MILRKALILVALYESPYSAQCRWESVSIRLMYRRGFLVATPMSIIVGVGRGAEAGILIRNAKALETMEKVDAIRIRQDRHADEGKPRVTSLEVVSEINQDELLRVVTSLEGSKPWTLRSSG